MSHYYTGLTIALDDINEAHRTARNAMQSIFDAMDLGYSQATIKACLEIIAANNRRAAVVAEGMAKRTAEHLNRHARVA
jgi:riboflavin synthase alpha subunit